MDRTVYRLSLPGAGHRGGALVLLGWVGSGVALKGPVSCPLKSYPQLIAAGLGRGDGLTPIGPICP